MPLTLEGPELPPVDPPSNLEYTVYGTLTYETNGPLKEIMT